MITPNFTLTQDADHVYVTIVAPHMRLQDAQIYYEHCEFIFHAKPYYLRLELPAAVQASERSSALEIDRDSASTSSNQSPEPNHCNTGVSFDCERNELRIAVPKAKSGEHFADLECVQKLLTGPKAKPSRRLIQVLHSSETSENPDLEEEKDCDEDEEDDFDWNIEQKLPKKESEKLTENIALLLGRERYGFANRYEGVLERLGAEIASDLVDLVDPGKANLCERRRRRIAAEIGDFCEDHYIADLYDTQRIDQLIEAKAPWELRDTIGGTLLSEQNRQKIIANLAERFSDFPERISPDARKALMLGVVDLLFAYAYDLRTNDFEHTSESGWTLRKLSPTLSWFETWVPISRDDDQDQNLDQDLCQDSDMASYVLRCCIRRSLIYPLYRNWKLSLRVAQDVVTIIRRGGLNAIIDCFLDMYQLFDGNSDGGGGGDNQYLLNDLYIGDYCAWLLKQQRQQKRNDAIERTNRSWDSLARHLAARLRCGAIDRADLRLDLVLIEKAAEIAWQSAEQSERANSNRPNEKDEVISEISCLHDKLRLAVKQSNANNLDSDDDNEEHAEP